MKTWLRLLSLLLCGLMAVSAAAQTEADKTTARNLFFEAGEAIRAGDYAKAAKLYERSNRLYPAPTAALGLARALTAKGELVRAYETYVTIVNNGAADDAPEPFKNAVAVAEEDRVALEPRLPSLIIQVSGPETATVHIDEVELSPAALGVKRFVDPGEHRVSASAEGFVDKVETVTVAEGEARQVSLTLQPEEAAAPPVGPPAPSAATPSPDQGAGAPADGSGMRVAGYVVGGVGVASLLVAAITTGIYVDDENTVDEHCRSEGEGVFVCDTEEDVDAAERGQTVGVINTVTLFAGLGVTALGVTLILLAGDDEPVAITPRVGPQSAMLSLGGRF